MPSSPRRRERLRDRSKQPQGSCRADQANLVRCYTAAKAATMPLSRGASFRYKSPAAGGERAVDIVRVGGLLAMPCPHDNAANAACPRRRKTDLTARHRGPKSAEEKP
jgi:hypothetical protein